MNQVTIQDIANKLNVSKSTVSRALKDHPDISAETKKAVLELAETLDYQPNILAINLFKNRTNTIGVLIPSISHHFFSQIISGIQEVAFASGNTILISQSNDSFDRELIDVQNFIYRKVDGLIISPTVEFNNGNSHLEKITSKGIPLVFIDRADERINACKVLVDDFAGAYKAVEHLIAVGCKKIAHFGADPQASTAKNRLEGYLQALKDHQIPIEENLILETGFSMEGGANGARQLMEMADMPDAIFAVLDDVAIGATLVLKENGIKIPEEVAIVGFSNDTTCLIVDPKLSSVNQPALEMGRKAAELILSQVEKSCPAETIILKTELIVRASSSR